MSKANRNRRVWSRRLAAQRKNTVTIAEYYTKTERRRYILHDDDTRTLLDVEPYWHGEPPITVMRLDGWPWDAVNTYENNGISRE